MAIIREAAFQFGKRPKKDIKEKTELTHELEVGSIPTMSWSASRGAYIGKTDYTWFVGKHFLDSHAEIPYRLRSKYLEADVWIYGGKVYISQDRELSPEDVRALLNVEKNKRRLTLEKAHALQAMTEQLEQPRQRRGIPQQIRVAVWQRDSGRCVECGSQDKLEFDHIIPVALGGANTDRNVQLLCQTCNRRKGASLG